MSQVIKISGNNVAFVGNEVGMCIVSYLMKTKKLGEGCHSACVIHREYVMSIGEEPNKEYCRSYKVYVAKV